MTSRKSPAGFAAACAESEAPPDSSIPGRLRACHRSAARLQRIFGPPITDLQHARLRANPEVKYSEHACGEQCLPDSAPCSGIRRAATTGTGRVPKVVPRTQPAARFVQSKSTVTMHQPKALGEPERYRLSA